MGTASTLENIDAVRAMIKRAKLKDHIFGMIGLICIMLILLTLLILFVDLVVDGYPKLFSSDFYSNFPSRRAAKAGLLSALVGSSLVMLVTFISAVPMGVGAAIYLEEYAPKNWFTEIIEVNVTNLAAVPSIIYGLLALGLFVYTLDFGNSILTAGLTLGLLILPREAAYAVGATKGQVVGQHVVRYSAGGILTGVIIGMARAIGETAPVITIGALTFIAFLPESPISSTPPFINFEWLTSGFTVLPIQMFSWLSRPSSSFHVNAAAAGAIIILVTLLMNGIAIRMRYNIRKKIKWQ